MRKQASYREKEVRDQQETLCRSRVPVSLGLKAILNPGITRVIEDIRNYAGEKDGLLITFGLDKVHGEVMGDTRGELHGV